MVEKQNKNDAVECNVKNRYENSDKCSIGESDYDETQKIEVESSFVSHDISPAVFPYRSLHINSSM